MYLTLFYTHSSPAVSYWLCISARFPSPLLRWDINRHNWRNENLIIKDNGFVHIYTSAASTSCQVVSFILKSFPTPLCSPHRIRVLFPSISVCRFLSAVVPLSLSPIRKWPVRALREKKERRGRQNSTFRGGQQPSSTRSPVPQTPPFRPFTPSFLLHSHQLSRFLSGWWMDERNLRSGLYEGPGVMFSGMLGLLFAHLWSFNNSIWCNSDFFFSINHTIWAIIAFHNCL